MNPALAAHLVEFLRREKPALRELPIPAYVDRILAEIEAAGFGIRKKNDGFKPKAKDKAGYMKRVAEWMANFKPAAWQEAFPGIIVEDELKRAVIWLGAAAEGGKYKTRFDQFFHNWLSRAKPATSMALKNPGQELGPRESIIAEGIRALAASRAEKLFPTEFMSRLSVCIQDLKPIPDEHLAECFARARALELRGTPGSVHVLDCWKAVKTELRRAADRKHVDMEAQRKLEEEERWNSLTPEQQAAEIQAIHELLRETQEKLA